MRVLQISEADQGGGAERIAYDLHRASLAAGHDSHLLVGYKRGSDTAVTGLVPEGGAARFAYRCLRALEQRSGVQARFYWMAGAWLRRNLAGRNPVHLHNLHGKYFNLGLLPWLARQAQVVVTLHDCWFFTGHCAYVLDCEGWREDCDPCCDIRRYPGMERDAARGNLSRKRELFARSRSVLVTPSQWLCDLVRRSRVLGGMECRVIPNGIDTERFAPGDRGAARRRLGLPLDKRIILCVVNGGLNATVYKDPELLLAAVALLSSGPLAGRFHLVVVGGTRTLPESFDGCVSQVADTREGLQTFYQAADLLLYPTKADNCPLVPMEAMSCGVPVVTTRVGGVPEVVRHGVTGLVTPPGEARDFAEAIASLLGSPSQLAGMGREATQLARERYSLERMAQRYFEIYEQCGLAGRSRS